MTTQRPDSRPDDPAPLPKTDPQNVSAETMQRLAFARGSAVDLLRKAEELEAQARDTRRRARSRLKHYENLLAEFQGQMSVFDEEGVL